MGGGGLFLPDTSPNGNSHWQWNVPDALLARLTAPLAVFAVGYNVFDGQHYRRATLRREPAGPGRAVGLLRPAQPRLHRPGPRAAARLLRDRVRYQPCPTTVARHLVPELSGPAQRSDTVLVNCAYDRAGLRFGHDYGHFLAQMAPALRSLRKRADVRYAAHMPADERFVHDLRREHGIALPVEQLYDRSNDEIRELFRRARGW